MTSILILTDALSETQPNFAFRVAEVVGERYPVQSIGSVQALFDALGDPLQAVVLLQAEPDRLVTLLRQCRNLLPGTVLVALYPANATGEAYSVLDTDCLFLTEGFTDFQLLAVIAAAVRQAELLSSIADSTQLDEVTNLFNRRYFMLRLSEEISLSRRHLSPLCCVILSVDLYRMYLDSYGYTFVNALLRFLADKVGGMVRHEDMIARIGDDEIAILLPRSTEAGAKIFTSRLVQNLNQLVFKYGNYVEDIAVCAGVAGYPFADMPNADADTVVRYGRHALYQAKANPDSPQKVQLFSEIRPAL